MGFGKRVIGLLTGVFLAAAVLAGAVEYSQTQTFAVSAEVTGATYTERIRGWQKEPGEFYIFLPGYASLDGTILQAFCSLFDCLCSSFSSNVLVDFSQNY